jgi:hypothetical protein
MNAMAILRPAMMWMWHHKRDGLSFPDNGNKTDCFVLMHAQQNL